MFGGGKRGKKKKRKKNYTQYLGGPPIRHHVVIALEVGASQTAAAMSTRAQTLLQNIPTLQFVILVKIHDDTTAQCGRLYAWIESPNPGGPVQSPVVEFGPITAGGAVNPAYWAVGPPPASRPFLQLPPLPAVPGFPAVPHLNLDLGALLQRLRLGGWIHYPAP